MECEIAVDVKKEGERGSDLNVQWTLSGELLNMSTVPNFLYVVWITVTLNKKAMDFIYFSFIFYFVYVYA